MSDISRLIPAVEINHELRVADYLLNRLSDEERVIFENELRHNKELSQQLENEIQLSKLIKDCQPPVQLAANLENSGFDKFSLLTAENDRVTNSNQSTKQDLTHANKKRSRSFPAALVASLLVAATVIFLPNEILNNSKDQGFKTLSNGEQQLVENPSQDLYSIIFHTNLSASERSELAKSLNLEFIPIPLDKQLYLVRAQDALESNQIKEIQSLEQVLFFEPAILRKKE